MIRMISFYYSSYWLSLLYVIAPFLLIKNTLSFKLFFVLIFFAFPFSVLANENIVSNTGGYAGVRLGYSYNHHSCVDMAVECDREDSGYGFFTGYEFNNHFALELSATELGDTKVIYPNVSLIGELAAVDVSVKYTRTLHKNIQAFGKLGVAYWDGKIIGWENTLKDSGKRPVAGVGIQFPLFSHIDGRVEYQYFDQLGNNWMGYTDAHFLSFSFLWRFSATKKYTSTLSKVTPQISLATPFSARPSRLFFSEGTLDQYVEHVLSNLLVEL